MRKEPVSNHTRANAFVATGALSPCHTAAREPQQPLSFTSHVNSTSTCLTPFRLYDGGAWLLSSLLHFAGGGAEDGSGTELQIMNLLGVVLALVGVNFIWMR